MTTGLNKLVVYDRCNTKDKTMTTVLETINGVDYMDSATDDSPSSLESAAYYDHNHTHYVTLVRCTTTGLYQIMLNPVSEGPICDDWVQPFDIWVTSLERGQAAVEWFQNMFGRKHLGYDYYDLDSEAINLFSTYMRVNDVGFLTGTK